MRYGSREVTQHRSPVLVGEHRKERDYGSRWSHSGERVGKNCRSFKIVRDVEDVAALALEAARDVHVRERVTRFIERCGVRRSRRVEQYESECDILSLMSAGQRCAQRGAPSKTVQNELGSLRADLDFADHTFLTDD